MKKIVVFSMFVGLMFCFQYNKTFGQLNINVHIGQPETLVADAGKDTVLSPGKSIQLGGRPAALHGNGGNVYQWTPVTGIDIDTIANPVASPGFEVYYTLTVTDKKGCIAEDEIHIQIDNMNSIDNMDRETGMEIYPNPVKNELQIRVNGMGFDHFQVSVISSSGELVYTKEFANSRVPSVFIKVGDLKAGIYLIQLKPGKGNVITQKFVID